ncbi:MAG: Uma2 family endonuclease [Gemmatimonadota bacterium]
MVVSGRLHTILATYLGRKTNVVGPGVVEHAPETHLEPDLLVFPSPIPTSLEWTDLSGHWLAVEVLSRGSRRYDQDLKRNAYLALGVREVWLVDWQNREILRSIAGGVTDGPFQEKLRWRPAKMGAPLVIDLEEVFEGLDR